MLNFILVVYVASGSASFQTLGPFDTISACESMKSQMAENFKDIKSACLSMNTQSIQTIVASKYDKQAKLEAYVPLPKPKPAIKIIKNCK